MFSQYLFVKVYTFSYIVIDIMWILARSGRIFVSCGSSECNSFIRIVVCHCSEDAYFLHSSSFRFIAKWQHCDQQDSNYFALLLCYKVPLGQFS